MDINGSGNGGDRLNGNGEVVQRKYVDEDEGVSSDEEEVEQEEEEEEEEEGEEEGMGQYMALIGDDGSSDSEGEGSGGGAGSTDQEEDEFGPFLDAAISAVLDADAGGLGVGGAGGAHRLGGDVAWAPEPEAASASTSPSIESESAPELESTMESGTGLQSIFVPPSIAPLSKAQIQLIKERMSGMELKFSQLGRRTTGAAAIANAILDRKPRVGDESNEE